jgi:DNA primase
MDNKERAKQVSMLDIITKMEVLYKRESGHIKICCPFHEENTPSLALYEDHYHCYGCGEHGDNIDFVQKVFKVDFNTAIQMLLNI